jgi:Predicted membrane protein
MIDKKYYIYILFLFLLSFLIYLDVKNTTLLYDDVYSIFLIKQPYTEIVKITASDVHPPLYYWGLKTYSYLFGSSLSALRLFSVLGIIATLLLGHFLVRQMFGGKIASSFLLLLLIFPVTQYLAVEIRMYSWTMFFVLACALSAYMVFLKGRKKDWIFFFITGICSAYLHNYGLLSVFGIYIILFISFILKKKKCYNLLIWGILFFFAYLPWLIQLTNQISAISGDYWIKPLTINDLFLHIYYFYSPKEVWLPFSDFTKGQMMIGLILIMTLQLIITLKVLKEGMKKKDDNVWLAVLAFIAFVIPVLIGAFISAVYIPVLVTRYMTCSFGLFVLSLAFILARSFDYPMFKKIACIFLLLLFVDAGLRFYSGTKYYNETEAAYSEIRHFIKDSDSRQLIVNDFSYHVMPRLQLISPGNEYYVLCKESTIENFEPFTFDRINEEELSFDMFILVHQERDVIQKDFCRYRKSIESNYIIIDSLHTSDIYLYRMQRIDK